MGFLRLLYCDSAGVRRCRVLVCPDNVSVPAAGAAAEAPLPAPAVSALPSLDVTPSIALAAAAGAIATPTGGRQPLPSSKSLGRVSEDRVLSPEHTGEPAADTATANAAAGPAPTLPSLNSLTTSPGLHPSPSMILAAAAGAIPAPAGAHFSRPQSFDSFGSRCNSRNSLDELQLQQQGQGFGGAAEQDGQGVNAVSRINSAASLEPSPSMTLAAAAGAIAAPGLGAAGAAAVPPRQGSPSRLSAASSATQQPPPQQQQQQQQQQSMVPMTKLAAARPRPLVSAFVRPPPGVTCSLLGGAVSPSSAAAEAVASLSVAAAFSVGLTKSCMGQPAFADVVCEESGLAPVGEVLLVPDRSAAVAASWLPDTHIAPVVMMEKDLSQPWSCCPRSALQRSLTRLEARFGLSLMAGFELEFLLLRPAPLDLIQALPQAADTCHVMLCGGQAWVPVDDTIYCQSAALTPGITDVLQEVVVRLQEVGIGVVQYHAEAAPGQFEIALQPFPALQAADKLLLAREVLGGVAAAHGLAVSHLAKPLSGHAGSGCHVHLSLWRGSTSVMADTAAAAGGPGVSLPPGCHRLSASASSFMAGVLDHLPALLPFTAPSPNSYERLKPCCWSGAHLCWGYDNREAPLRVCCPRGGPGATNVEFKAFDGSTNPYIGLAAIVAAGMTGLEQQSSLPPPTQLDPGASRNAAAASGLQQLPSSLQEALTAYQEDTALQAALRGVLGEELLTAFLAVRRCEEAAATSTSALLLRY